MTESTTPGNPFGRGPRDEAGYAPTGPAGWAAYFAAGTAAQEVPENLPIIERLGDWHVFGKRPSTWGEIYFCVPAPESRIAAVLKALPRDLTFDAEARRAFQRECAIGLLASFYAFGILPVLGIHVQDGRPFIVMPAVMAGPRGEVNLRDLLRVGPVPLADAVFFARTIAEALATAGKHLPGLVHGDLKPENILIWNRIPFIADFGLARCAARRLGGDSLVGTPEYRAPEADDPRAVLETSADVYSYGVILTETLTGRPPDRGELATSRSRALVTRALLDLANRCRRQDPAARPSDFTAIIAAIEEIAPAAEWPGPEIAKVMLMADILRVAQTRSQVALDLLRLEQYDMAIDFIESSTDPDSRDAELWMHHGTALSLSDPPRDEEALGSYQRALAVLPAADTEKAWRIGIELAASLKRLRRFDEAEALLESLIEEAPDENWFYSSANNLGALWTDKGLHHEADKLLSQVVAKLPDFAQAWHNRAWAQQRMGNVAAAALMQQRAVAADPANPRWHARLGMILMDELCFLDDAATAFSNAMACGSLEPEVMTRALACAVATGDQRRAEDLLSKIGAAYGHDVPEHAVSTANRWVFWLQRKFGGPGGPASGELPEAVAQALAEIGLSDPLETPTPGETAEPAFSDSGDAADGDTPRTAADVTDLSGSDADDRSRLDSEPDQGVPDQRFHHLQLRLAATGFAYMDFYEPFDEQDYGHAFRGQYRRAWVTAPMMGGVLADTPFHLLRCLSCSAELASNRPDGSSLKCQRCYNRVEVKALAEPGLAGLMSILDELLGRESHSLDGWELLLVLQIAPTDPYPAPSKQTLRSLDKLLARYGVERLEAMHPGVLVALANGHARGNLSLTLPWIGGLWQYPHGATGTTSTTPPQIHRLLDEARRVVLPALIASTTLSYDATSGEPSVCLWQGRPDDAERRLRERVPRREDASLWLALSNTALMRGDSAKALSCAEAATKANPEHAPAWTALGSLRLAKGDVNGAKAAADLAHRLDLTDSNTCILLARCYEQEGRPDDAGHMALRARALGHGVW